MAPPDERRTIVAGIDIPFGDLVWFFIKAALAAIPAAIALVVITTVVSALLLGAVGVLPGVRADARPADTSLARLLDKAKR